MPAPKFTHDGILDATAQEVLQRGAAVTIGDVSQRLGAPSGSIYHRFASREELLVRLWLRSVRRFHEAYLAASDNEDPEQALIGMARCVASFTAQHQADAVSMTMFRHSRLIDTAPESCQGEVRTINDTLHVRLAKLAEARYTRVTPRHLTLVRVAAIDCPYGLVQPYVWTTIPDWMTSVIEASSRAVLGLADAPAT